MAQIVTLPDGSTATFPDEATPEMMHAALGLAPLAQGDSNVVQSPNGVDNSNSVSRLPWLAQQAGLAFRAITEGAPLPTEIGHPSREFNLL